MSWEVVEGDALEVLKEAEGQVDALVCDPPAGISFMGKEWDHDHGGREGWVRAFSTIFAECLRLMKPGAHGLVWALPRTSHWTACALEDAGFEVRDIVTHHFGTGFPKSLDVSKAIDKKAGIWRGRAGKVTIKEQPSKGTEYERNPKGDPVTDAAKRWQGFGTALKPATEHWILVRKPLAGTVAANVLEHGTGALNIDGCRVETVDHVYTHGRRATENGWDPRLSGSQEPSQSEGQRIGRWPANLVLSHAAACEPAGTEEVEAWNCSPGCPVAALDEQSGSAGGGFGVRGSGSMDGRTSYKMGGQDQTVGDKGGASRFFYVAKANKRERGAGLGEGEQNRHPTVKSVALMRWLVRLVTPPGGEVLDPFCGSGSTGVAAVLEGMDFIGVERDHEYAKIARARIEHAEKNPQEFEERKR